MFKGFEALASVLESEFGVGPIAASPVTAIWAAEFLLANLTVVSPREASVHYVKDQLSAFNTWRDKKGKTLAYLNFGHPLF